jgi:hypothetical protein
VLKRLRPSAVVLGAGSWLHDRSTSPYLPTYGLQYMYAYIARDDAGGLTVKQPPPGHSLRHRFELSRLYFPDGRRDRELNAHRLKLLQEVGPTVLAAARAAKRWRSDIGVAELYDFTISRLEQVTAALPGEVPLVVLWLARDPGDHPPLELVRVVQAYPTVSLVDGAQALAGLSRREILRRGHPSAIAHKRFGELLARELGKSR